MPVDSLSPLAPLPRLGALTPPLPLGGAAPASGFAQVLNGLLANSTQAYEASNAAVRDLVTGNAQDLHTVTLAVAQADMSFRLLLEIRNRLTDAFQEITRMQV